MARGKVKINSDSTNQVRINAEDGKPVSINYIVPVTPSAPVIVQENNVTKQIWFHAPSGYKANQCAYIIKGGEPINATSTVIQLEDDNYAPGDIEIYVREAPGIIRSESVFNEEEFTQEIFMTGVTAHSEAAADFYTSGTNGMFLNAAEVTRVTVTGTATKVQFKLAAVPSTLTFFWFFVYRKDGATYDRVKVWQLVPRGDLVVGVNEMYLPSQWDIQAGDYVGWAHSGNSGNVAMYPRINDTESGNDIYRATVISAPASDKDFEGGTAFTNGYWPIIFKGL